MVINPLCEQLISLKEAAKLFPKNARGKHPHVSAIYRYTTTGCRGVVLESIQAGSRRCTSKEAIARFFGRLTRQANAPAIASKSTKNIAAAEEAGRILDETIFKSRLQRRTRTSRPAGRTSNEDATSDSAGSARPPPGTWFPVGFASPTKSIYSGEE